MMNLRGEQVIVLGLGQTGASCVRWLHAQGARVRVLDTRNTPPELSPDLQNQSWLQVNTGPFTDAGLSGARLIVASPGIDLRAPAVAKQRAAGVPIVGDIELFAQALNTLPAVPRVVAITGSNGKSTVTSMVGAMCQAAGLRTVVAGNIGVPVLGALTDAQTRQPDVYVLELSSFQLETTANLQLVSATVLNVTQDHMDRYDSLQDYANAKARIFLHCMRRVVNREDVYSFAALRAGDYSFGTDAPSGANAWGLARETDGIWLAQGTYANEDAGGYDKLMRADELPVAGLHNAANALAALALCRALDLPYAPLTQALREFKGLAHRVERVAQIGGVTFYDDSKGTNVGATVAALRGMTQPVVLIAGGDGKSQDFAPLKAAVDARARAVVLIGRDAPLIEQALHGSRVPRMRARDLADAVEQAHALAQAGDAVLLSPACASFDMFRNYAHRAEVFVAAVRELAQRKGGEN
jgi:UDP-N-acetylmuramoylalanine--D-glutamate ligase